jgi:sulfoxide reductase catalytic subunit YedY
MPRRNWEIPEREATPEHVYLNRRKFLKTMGYTGLSAAGILAGCSGDAGTVLSPVQQEPPPQQATSSVLAGDESILYPAPLNPDFATLDRRLTQEDAAAVYNNFFEFTVTKQVWRWVEPLTINPWSVEIAGLVQKPKVYDLDELVRKMPLEERLYRHRCVEAWAMAVPWTGFPMKALIDAVQPLAAARFVKMTSFFNPAEAKSQDELPGLPWAYTEGLSMEEATNELTLLATGMYGHELLKQHGAPIRLVVPWKYGFKSVKSIVRIEFTSELPATFWNELVPLEYGFEANVNPAVPHPRWSQERESMLGSEEIRPTLLYNGYEEYVAHMYG